MYKRKTVDCFDVMGLYNGQWEVVTSADTRREARSLLNDYRQNENGAFKIKKYREKIIAGDYAPAH